MRPAASIARDCLIALTVLVSAAVPRNVAAESHRGLGEILSDWYAHVASLGEISDPQRERELRAFLGAVPWENVARLCTRRAGPVHPDSVGMLRALVRHRLTAGEPPVEALARLVEDHACLPACTWELLDWEREHRETLGTADRERLALALLRADAPELPIQMRRRLLTGAVQLSAADTLMTVMMAAARAPDEIRAELAIRSLATSIDPRAPDSLALLIRTFAASGSPRVDAAVVGCRKSCAERALDVLIEIQRSADDRQRRRRALLAVARAPRPVAAATMLAAYGGGAVADSTFALAGDQRQRHYDLWLAVRIAEPYLCEWLRTGDEERAALAVELFDRALRFGPPIEPGTVVQALDAWIGRAPAASRGRAVAVRARAADPPPGP